MVVPPGPLSIEAAPGSTDLRRTGRKTGALRAHLGAERRANLMRDHFRGSNLRRAVRQRQTRSSLVDNQEAGLTTTTKLKGAT